MIKILLASLVLLFACPRSAVETENIRINQLGYYPFAQKIAVAVGAPEATRFFILSATRGDTVFRGNLSAPIRSQNSSLVTRKADFTAFTKTGRYRIFIPGAGLSYPFIIGEKSNYSVAVSTLKGFYYQRVSTPLEARFAGRWARAAGHPDTAVLVHPSAASASRPAGFKLSSPGGWYDAGDYNKYIVNSGITMGTLLSAYEDFSKYFDTLKLNIPESNDRIPDLLNEVLCNLRWMITMQDPADGGVYHKCTNASFDGMVMPGVTKAPRYVMQKSVAATLDFAAVMAQAARIFSSFSRQLPGLSDSCILAAELAWVWSQQNPALGYDQNAINRKFQPPVSTGAYGDRNFNDEWLWAASELLTTTGNRKYLDTVLHHLDDSISLSSWSNVALLGYYSLLRNQKKLHTQLADQWPAIKKKLLLYADTYTGYIEKTAFHAVMGRTPRDFVWGSNAVAANQGILLINAYLVTKNKKYADLAMHNLDYLLGRNATGYCFVTGVGSRYPMHPHHRPSVADGIIEPVPGLLVGGPNPAKQDGCRYEFSEPETTYADIDCSYASNEIAINWNAPIVYLANALEALQYKIGYSK